MQIDPPSPDPRDDHRHRTARVRTLLTHHAQMLLTVARQPDARVLDLAAAVGVTPRAALALLQDLEDVGHLHRTRVGRRNYYTIHPESPVRDPVSGLRTVGEFLTVFAGDGTGLPVRTPRARRARPLPPVAGEPRPGAGDRSARPTRCP